METLLQQQPTLQALEAIQQARAEAQVSPITCAAMLETHGTDFIHPLF